MFADVIDKAAILLSPFCSADGLAFRSYLKPGFPHPYAGAFRNSRT
jgi:hypothetical protein